MGRQSMQKKLVPPWSLSEAVSWCATQSSQRHTGKAPHTSRLSFSLNSLRLKKLSLGTRAMRTRPSFQRGTNIPTQSVSPYTSLRMFRLSIRVRSESFAETFAQTTHLKLAWQQPCQARHVPCGM